MTFDLFMIIFMLVYPIIVVDMYHRIEDYQKQTIKKIIDNLDRELKEFIMEDV